jgi:hypothetical protein
MGLRSMNKITQLDNKINRQFSVVGIIAAFIFCAFSASAQEDAKANARIDATQIMVGDQARLFIEVQNNAATGRIEWAVIPDTFNSLEVVERGKIDTVKQGGLVTYKQRLLITGFDSGLFKIPPFTFPVIPNSGNPYTVQTDSFGLLVQTVAVDTTKGFKGIKGIMYVKSSWLDYLWYIIGGIVFLVLFAWAIIYYMRRKKKPVPVPAGPPETLQERTLRLLAELDARALWQKEQVKEYYVELTDIVRNYIEERFQTPAMELTTDELLYKVRIHRELQRYHDLLSTILHTADLAKFAKAQPAPQEHVDAMEKSKMFVKASPPPAVIPEPVTTAEVKNNTPGDNDPDSNNPDNTIETPTEKTI